MDGNVLDKYAEHYFEHYLVCTNYAMSDEGFIDLAHLYLRIEGKDEFHKLVDEINLIEANDDWDAFVLHKKKSAPGIDRATVQKIASVAKCVFEGTL